MGRLTRLLDWIDRRVDKPASRHPYSPGSEQMISSETPKATGESVRNRRTGGGLGPGRRGL